jgi:hypothetical protein
VNPALRAHLAEAARLARPDWRPAAIGAALGRLEQHQLTDPQALHAVGAAAADPQAQPRDIGYYGTARPVHLHRPHQTGPPDPATVQRGLRTARQTLAARRRTQPAGRRHPDEPPDQPRTGDDATR